MHNGKDRQCDIYFHPDHTLSRSDGCKGNWIVEDANILTATFGSVGEHKLQFNLGTLEAVLIKPA